MATERGKLTVAFGLEETLLYVRSSGEGPDPEEAGVELPDGALAYVTKRPGLDEFLAAAAEQFELVIFTKRSQAFADPLVDWIDPHRQLFRHRLYRDACDFIGDNCLKDVAKLNRPLARCALVDSKARSLLQQPDNGIPMQPFQAAKDPQDRSLAVLLKYLKKLDANEDVRHDINKRFKLSETLAAEREQLLSVAPASPLALDSPRVSAIASARSPAALPNPNSASASTTKPPTCLPRP